MYGSNPSLPQQQVRPPIIALTGISGGSYPSELYAWGTPFRPIGAVYAVLRRNADGRYAVLYVGETADLSCRFDCHHKQPCFDRQARTHIAVLPEGTASRRLQIEADLVAAYRPVCNG